MPPPLYAVVSHSSAVEISAGAAPLLCSQPATASQPASSMACARATPVSKAPRRRATPLLAACSKQFGKRSCCRATR
ncbi:unnamed protein product [Linum trigynum]|uniref:Uncharacterized protein n=1 Tax=Linum trigynum TaxID=586398 RepID=A0AAV2GSQ0_9ROSI